MTDHFDPALLEPMNLDASDFPTDLEAQRNVHRMFVRYLPDSLVTMRWESPALGVVRDRFDVESHLRDVIDAKLKEFDLRDALWEHAEQQVNEDLWQASKESVAPDGPASDGASDCENLLPETAKKSPINFANDHTNAFLRSAVALMLFADCVADDGYNDRRVAG